AHPDCQRHPDDRGFRVGADLDGLEREHIHTLGRLVRELRENRAFASGRVAGLARRRAIAVALAKSKTGGGFCGAPCSRDELLTSSPCGSEELMQRFRFNIAALVGLIFACGVAFASLKESSELWESAVFSLTLVVILVAALLAIHRTGERRH